MPKSKQIAVVEDEPTLAQNYSDSLTKMGYQVNWYPRRQDALKAFDTRLPDLALIDVGLADDVEGGFELCRELRSRSATLPIIFLTARDSELDMISGLRLGADDYLTKDTSMVHIQARIVALFRRVEALSKINQHTDVLEVGDLSISLARMQVSWCEHHVDLTVTELWMVHALAKNPGHVKNRQQLMDAANVVLDDNTITSHIKRIRKKFAALDADFDRIVTAYGMGYRWLEPSN